MSITHYTGSGTVFLSSCIAINFNRNWLYKWKVGDACFLRFRAIKGKLEKIVIKQVRIVSNDYINGLVKFMYLDTFNALYGEEDLLTEKEAVLLAKQYYQYQLLLNIEAKSICNQRPQGKNSFQAPNSIVGGFA